MPVVIVTGLLLGGFMAIAIERAVRARREPVRTGYEELIGQLAEVRVVARPRGPGLRRRGRCGGPASPTAKAGVGPGDRVRVEAVDGLTCSCDRRAEAESEKGAG